MSKNGVFDWKFMYLYYICNVCRTWRFAVMPTIVFEIKQGFLS